MQGFLDATTSVDERRTERMNFRAKPHVKASIQKAAALAGVDESVFTMSAAYRAATKLISAHERTVLTPADHGAFFAALETPAEPTAALRAAFERHRDTVTSR